MSTAELRARVRKACMTRDKYRVVVEPVAPFGSGSILSWQSRCDTVIKGILRHIDDVAQAYMQSDAVCKFCGYGWEEGEGGQPQCCNAAIDEFDRLVQEAQDAPTDE